MFQFSLIKTGIHADEKGIVHNRVGIGKVSHQTVMDINKCRMTQKVSAEEVPCFDSIHFQEAR